MPFLAPVIGAIGAFAGTAIGKIVIGVGASVIGSLLSKALAPKPPEQPKPGVRGNLAIGGDSPLSFIVGLYATAGHRVYAGTWGSAGKTPNAYFTDVVLLSDVPIDGLATVYVNGERCTVDWNATPTAQGYPVLQYRRGGKDHMWVRFRDGTHTTVDSFLSARFGSAERPWSNDMIGRGKAYATVTMLFDRDVWQGFPTVLFECRGIRCYDIRLDSTAGGSGSHRRDNPATWTFTRNPWVIAYNVAFMGVRFGSEWVWGLQNLPAIRLPLSAWVAAMNECDLSISLAGGGTEPQFQIGGEITCDMQPADFLDEVAKSTSGRLIEVGGYYKPLVGIPGTAVYSFTDDDIVITEGQSYQPFPGLEATHNTIEASYPEPAEAWGMKAAPVRSDPAFIAADGDRKLVAGVQFPMVFRNTQVQRLTKAELEDARRFRVHNHSLPPIAWLLEPGDLVSWTSARNGYVDKKFLVGEMGGRRTFVQAVMLKETEPDDFDWVPANDEQPWSVGPIETIRPPAQPMTGWQAVPATILDANGVSRRPSIEVRYDGEQEDVRAVRVQVRLKETQAAIFDGEIPYDPEEESPAVVLNGVFLPNTVYEVRGKYVPFSGRETDFSTWLEVLTPDIRLGPLDVIFGDINLDELGTQFDGLLDWIGGNVRDLIEQSQAQAVLTGDQELANAMQFDELRRSLSVAVGDLSATFEETITTAIIPMNGQLVAFADALTELSAGDGADVSTARFRMTAQTGPDGGVTIGMQGRTGTEGAWRDAGAFLNVPNDPGADASFLVLADKFAVRTTGENAIIPFSVSGETIAINAVMIGPSLVINPFTGFFSFG